MKNLCVKLSGVGALLICVPVMYRIAAGDMFNPMSYFLWSFLSLICGVVLIRAKKGGHTMMAGYFFSDFSVGIFAYVKSGKASFGGFEYFVAALTVACICIYVWCELRKSFKPAVISNAIACVIAGIPLMVDALQNPNRMSLFIANSYLLISLLAYYGEQTFNGKLIPGLSVVYWIIILVGVTVQRL